MKMAVMAIFILWSVPGFSQVTAVWMGNSPGHEKEWGYPANWSTNRVPDEFTDVVIRLDISVRRGYPVLKSGDTEINSLTIWPGASLTLKESDLLILDPFKNNFNHYQIIGNGSLTVNQDSLFTDGLVRKN